MKLKLSVIIPYYNADAWIGSVLDSLLDQDLSPADYEIIVVDDGSVEEPLQLRRYVAENPTVIHYVRQENGGVSAARNTGIGLAKGDWLYFCDSDDLVQTQVLGQMLALAESNRLDMLFGRIHEVNPGESLPPSRKHFENLSPVWTGFEYIAAHPVMQGYGTYQYLIRRDFVETHQLRFRPYYFTEDRLYLLDSLFRAERVMEVDVDLYYYIQRESSIMHAQKRKHYEKKFCGPIRAYLSDLTSWTIDSSFPQDARKSLLLWRDVNSYYVLLDSFRYTSPQTLAANMDLLRQLGAYPLMKRGNRTARLIRWWMNHRRLWMAGSRIYHFLPLAVREKL